MIDVWLPEWERRPHPRPGYGPHRIQGGWKIVLHSTENNAGLDGEINYNNRNKSTATYHAIGDISEDRVAQQAPLDRYVGGMKNPDRFRVDTNGSRCIQLCVTGYSRDAHTMTDDELRWIGLRMFAPVMRRYPIDRNVVSLRHYGDPYSFTAATPSSRARQHWQPYDQFERWSGVLQHGTAPLNDHWDYGWIDLDRICLAAWAAINPPPIKPAVPDAETYRPSRRRTVNLANVEVVEDVQFRPRPDAPDGHVWTFVEALGPGRVVNVVPRTSADGPHPNFMPNGWAQCWEANNEDARVMVVVTNSDQPFNADVYVAR